MSKTFDEANRVRGAWSRRHLPSPAASCSPGVGRGSSREARACVCVLMKPSDPDAFVEYRV